MKALSVASSSLLCVLLGSSLGAQSLTASISGIVTDTTGGALPGATVTVTNADTNVVAWHGVTNQDGNYLAPALPVGRHDITVELENFKTVAIRGVRLEVGQRARVDATLSPGEIKEMVTVVGDTTGRLETEDSSLGLVINTSQVRNLPLPSRNVLNLLTLAGGVSSGGAATGINASQLSINGSRTLNSEFTVDGVSVVSGSTGAVQRLPSTETIREFKVLTASYSAEYGRSAGGFVNVVVESGTNRLQGGVYEYFRNESLNANNFFNKLRGVQRPRDRYNQFGFKLGGPVRVPGLYNGQDKTFFFFNYEGLRRKQPGAPISTIPDLAFRSGDFSASPVVIIDPLTGQPFPGNRIPANRIDPAAARILSLLPAPNSQGSLDAANGRRINNYVNDQTNTPSENEVTLRVDHNAGANARLFGRFTFYDLFGPSTVIMPGPLNAAAGSSNTKGYQASLGWTHVWSPTLLTETGFAYLRNDPAIDPPTLGIDVRDVFGIERSAFAAAPRFNISGYRELGLNENTYRRQIDNNYQATFALTWARGNHTLKVGSQVRFNQFNVFNPGGAFTGIYNFNGEITSPTRASGNPVNALADFLLGSVKTAAYELAQPETGRRNYNLAFFAQEDWKVSRRLTLNLGLRYEYESPMTIDNDIHSRLDIRTARLLVAEKNASRSLDLEGDTVNFAPRVGLAYTLNDKTVVRSAFGVFYGQIFSNLGGIVLYPGFTVRQEFGSLGAGVPQPFRLSQGHPLTAVQNLDDPFFVERNASPSRPLVHTSNQFGEVNPLPYSMQWNIGIQRELWGGTIVDLSYVGSRGVHLPVVRNFNTVPFDRLEEVASVGTTLAAQQARPNPNASSFAAFVHEGNSSYHAAQVRASRRFSKRFAFQVTYTLSKSIDDGSGIFNFSQPYGLDVGDLAGAVPSGVNRGLSAFDRPHIFALAAQYETGGPKWLRGIQTNVIVTARSGLPDTIAQTNLHDWNVMPALPGASVLQQRPNVVGDSRGVYAPSRVQEGTGIRYLLPPTNASFPFRPSGPFFTGSGANRRRVVPFTGPGTLGRSTVREPSEFNVDLAVARRFKLAGRVGLTLRAEAFNVLNRVNLNGPNTSLNVAADPRTGEAVFNSPNFGLITSAKPARFMQLVARIDF